ncbi:MAG TPA: caspase family protein [Patescibacteria group bacterium]|nr:caspase family protein [Patescibacteria group bacterium]
MKTRLAALVAGAILAVAIPARAGIYYVTVAGIGGEPVYDQEFTQLARDLDKLFKSSGVDVHVFTLTGATRAEMTEVLAKVAAQAKPGDDFVLILIGHGTDDGYQYKFNLAGPDISAGELAGLCDKIPSRRQLIVDTSEASGGSVAALEGRGRAVIAATKDGREKNATVFARYFVQALHDPGADLNKDGSISALEAFEYARRHTADFYTAQKRLATEHAVFEDTGDHQAVRAPSAGTREGLFLSTFTLIRLGGAREIYNDPAKRALLAKKEELEREIDTLKYHKAAMSQEDYTRRISKALIELARVQEELDK